MPERSRSFDRLLGRYGVQTVAVDPTDTGAIRAAIDDRTRLVFVETIGNPRLDVPDIRALAAVAAERRVPLVVDATLATPWLFRAREHGAAIVGSLLHQVHHRQRQRRGRRARRSRHL